MNAAGSAVRLRIEYYFDPESRNWHFRVPRLGIIGGGQTRDEAERMACEAVVFALESEDDAASAEDGEVAHIRVTIGG